MNEKPDIVQAMFHRQLFGMMPEFQDPSTWSAWVAAVKSLYGLKLTADELLIFQQCTGRTEPREGGYPEFVAIVSRRGGKDIMVRTMAVFEAIQWEPKTGDPDVYVVIVCQDSRAAVRTTFQYIRVLFETVPILAGMVESITQDMIRLKNRVVIAVWPCRSQSVRGLKCIFFILNEFGHFITTDNIPQDRNMLQAGRPTLATTPSGKMIILSSPHARTGELWSLREKHYGRDDSPTLIWQASSDFMNPTLGKDYLERMRLEDPEGYLSEFGGEFRSGLSTFLDSESIQACVATGVRERTRIEGVQYVCFIDPSGGRHDSFVAAVAHDNNGRAVLDAIRIFQSPFNPTSVIAEICQFLKSWGVFIATGDNYAAEHVAAQFQLHGVQYQASTRNRSEIYLELLPLINSERISLLDHQDLLRELRGLERKRGTSGKDRVDHSSRAGSRDDIANACSGALVEASMPVLAPGVFIL